MRRPDRRRERDGPFYAHGQVRDGPRRDWSPWREHDFGPWYREARGGMSADPALRRGEWQRRGRFNPDEWWTEERVGRRRSRRRGWD